jgi:chitinase
LDQWTAAGFPASQLLLGLPLYGYVSNSTATGLTGFATPPQTFPIKPERAADNNIAIRPGGDLSSYYGQQIAFRDLVANGALVKLPDGTYTGTNGYTYGTNILITTVMLFRSCPQRLGQLFRSVKYFFSRNGG